MLTPTSDVRDAVTKLTMSLLSSAVPEMRVTPGPDFPTTYTLLVFADSLGNLNSYGSFPMISCNVNSYLENLI